MKPNQKTEFEWGLTVTYTADSSICMLATLNKKYVLQISLDHHSHEMYAFCY